ncbi:hypothetical protein TNCV_173111 [Trichonephila clavipes]|nr:hypothetical protein TNCV_173111 [Trichonephila clavipes]
MTEKWDELYHVILKKQHHSSQRVKNLSREKHNKEQQRVYFEITHNIQSGNDIGSVTCRTTSDCDTRSNTSRYRQWHNGEYGGPLQSQALGPKLDLTKDCKTILCLTSVRLWTP